MSRLKAAHIATAGLVGISCLFLAAPAPATAYPGQTSVTPHIVKMIPPNVPCGPRNDGARWNDGGQIYQCGRWDGVWRWEKIMEG